MCALPATVFCLFCTCDRAERWPCQCRRAAFATAENVLLCQRGEKVDDSRSSKVKVVRLASPPPPRSVNCQNRTHCMLFFAGGELNIKFNLLYVQNCRPYTRNKLGEVLEDTLPYVQKPPCKPTSELALYVNAALIPSLAQIPTTT